jgi:ABC-2 type transport system ATP-binding protein
MEGALRFTQVSKSFGAARRRVKALAEVSFTISTGRITGLIGPDGAGKTTLMRLAACLLMPDAGTITVLGLESKSKAQAIQSQIGYMPQRFGLYEDLTVRENLNLYADLQGLAHTERSERYDALLALTALGPFGDRRAGQLSGGMKQKLGLACALLRVPRLLLLDEPTVGVDPISRRELWAIIQGLKDQGVSVLISTSYMDEAERCDDIILLHEGRVLAQGPPSAFTTPLEGRCFFVQSAELSRRLLQQRLRAEAAVLDARLETSGVRVLLAQGAAPPSVAGAEWHRVAPRFADAFFDRLHMERASAEPVIAPMVRANLQENSKPEAVLSVSNLNRFFGSFHAVKDVSFTVHRGEVFGLLGANGAGKSTTFRMLCGLLPASSGVLNVAGQDLRTAPAEARRQIGYVAQKFSLYANLSVAQNLSFFASAYGLGGARRRERLAWAMEEFALAPYLAQNAGDLPLGFKQRLALAAALLHEPPILFLDEPTSGVDPLARTEFWQRINAYSASGTTVLITTHFMEEAEYCDHLVLMSLGEVLASGTPAEIRARAATPERPNPTMEEAFIALIEAHEATLRRSR